MSWACVLGRKERCQDILLQFAFCFHLSSSFGRKWQYSISIKLGLQVVVPPELGYGETGAPPDIPPNAVLAFELELVKIDQRNEL